MGMRSFVIAIALAACAPQPQPQPVKPSNEGVVHGLKDPPEPRPDAGVAAVAAVPDASDEEQLDEETRTAREIEARAAKDPDVLIGRGRETQQVYCGGAAPRPGQRTSVTGPYRGKVLVRKGKHNSTAAPVAELQPDKDGVFVATDLPKGTYCVVFESKRDQPQGKTGMYTDAQCLENLWKTCDAVVDIPSGKPAWINRHIPCFGPCYHGPLPP